MAEQFFTTRIKYCTVHRYFHVFQTPTISDGSIHSWCNFQVYSRLCLLSPQMNIVLLSTTGQVFTNWRAYHGQVFTRQKRAMPRRHSKWPKRVLVCTSTALFSNWVFTSLTIVLVLICCLKSRCITGYFFYEHFALVVSGMKWTETQLIILVILLPASPFAPCPNFASRKKQWSTLFDGSRFMLHGERTRTVPVCIHINHEFFFYAIKYTTRICRGQIDEHFLVFFCFFFYADKPISSNPG